MMRNLLFIILICGIANLQAQNVGIGHNTPINKLDINGNMSIGSGYSGSATAPTNGAIIEGNTGIGVSNPTHRLQVTGTSVLFNADFVNQEITGVINALNNATPLPVYNQQSIAVGTGGTIIQGASGVPMLDSILITDGNGVNNSGVLILAQVNVNSIGLTFSGNTRANFLIRLQRAQNINFFGAVTLYQSSGTAGLSVGAAILNTRDNVNVIYPDLALVAGVKYYYRILFVDLSGGTGTVGGSYSLTDRSLTILQIKR